MYDYSRMKNHINGVESCSYELFGAHLQDGGVYFSVYAPEALNVMLTASHNDRKDIQMNRDSLGVWGVFVEGIGEGVHYKYKIFTQEGEFSERSDPFAYYSEVRPDCASIVYDIDNYRWRDDEWIKNRTKNFDKPLNVYEVHLGTWKIKDGEQDDEKLFSYHELKEELIPYVKEMGYTHIEFLPLTEYPTDASLGYQVSGYYAPTSRYGEPRYFMDLIDTCHINGIGVILDFVTVHFARGEEGLSFFDGGCLYESEISQIRDTPWGSVRFDYAKPHVQSFVRSSLNFWINKYHVDGIRFDKTAYMIYPDGNPNSAEYDCGAWFLRNTLFTLNAYHSDVMFIADDSSCQAKDTVPAVYGGYGFDYMWNYFWSGETLRYMSTPYGMRTQNHGAMTFPMYYFNQGLFMLSLSHDDVSNGKASIMTKAFGRSQNEKFANLRAYYMFQMTHPGKKLNFMGNELAEFMEWKDGQYLSWSLLSYPNHAEFHSFIKELNKIYREEPALYTQDYDMNSFAWVDMQNGINNIYAFRRDDFNGNPLFVVLNFSPYERQYWLSVGYDGCFKEILNSDRACYGGGNGLNYELRSNDGFLNMELAPLSGIILKPCEESEMDMKPQDEGSAVPELTKENTDESMAE